MTSHRGLVLAASSALLLGGVIALAGCGANDDTSAASTSSDTATAATTTAATTTASTKLTAAELKRLTTDLPVGDGKYSTTTPKRGYVYSCQDGNPNAGGSTSTPWITDDTFSLDDKPVVEGKVSWPQAKYQVTLSGSERELVGNGLPVDTKTGTFPIAESDPAYQYDRNGNSIGEQTVDSDIPANPTMASEPACVPFGTIGYFENGVALDSALDARGNDAVANELQDLCQGHPQEGDLYHYHWVPTCLTEDDPVDEQSPVVAWALDGYPVTGPRDENGNVLTTADLDECHGRTSEIVVDGKTVNMYHYVGTYDFPYTIGCYRGSVVTSAHTAEAGTGNESASSLDHDHQHDHDHTHG